MLTSYKQATRFCDECGWSVSSCTCPDAGEIDKCLNCGRYKATESLTEDQVCRSGCVNPNEY